MDLPFLITGYVEKDGRIIDTTVHGVFEDLTSAYQKFEEIDVRKEYFSFYDKYYRRHERKRKKDPFTFRVELSYKGILSSSVLIAQKSFHMPRDLINDYLDSLDVSES